MPPNDFELSRIVTVWGPVAVMWHKPMTENLGYQRFATQGRDIGARVTSRLGYAHADNMWTDRRKPAIGPTPATEAARITLHFVLASGGAAP